MATLASQAITFERQSRVARMLAFAAVALALLVSGIVLGHSLATHDNAADGEFLTPASTSASR